MTDNIGARAACRCAEDIAGSVDSHCRNPAGSGERHACRHACRRASVADFFERNGVDDGSRRVIHFVAACRERDCVRAVKDARKRRFAAGRRNFIHNAADQRVNVVSVVARQRGDFTARVARAGVRRVALKLGVKDGDFSRRVGNVNIAAVVYVRCRGARKLAVRSVVNGKNLLAARNFYRANRAVAAAEHGYAVVQRVAYHKLAHSRHGVGRLRVIAVARAFGSRKHRFRAARAVQPQDFSDVGGVTESAVFVGIDCHRVVVVVYRAFSVEAHDRDSSAAQNRVDGASAACNRAVRPDRRQQRAARFVNIRIAFVFIDRVVNLAVRRSQPDNVFAAKLG